MCYIKKYFPIIVFLSLIISLNIHLYTFQMVLSILSVFYLIAIHMRFGLKETLLKLFLLKPIIDLTWNVSINLGIIHISSLKFIAVVIFIFLIKEVIISDKIKNVKKINTSFLSLFSVYLIFSTIIKLSYTSDLVWHFNNFIYLIRILDGLLIFYTFTYLYTTKQEIIKVVAYGWLGNLLVMLTNLFNYFYGNFTVDYSQGVERFNSIYNDPGGPAFVALCGLIFSIVYKCLLKRKFDNTLNLIYLLTHFLTIFTLYLTLTRGVMVSIIVFYTLWYGFYQRRKLLVIPIIITFCYWAYNNNEGINKRFETEVRYLTSEDKTFDMAQHLGGGRVASWYRYYDYFNSQFDLPEKIFGKRSFGVHNEYLAFLFKYGIIGLFFYGSLIVMFFKLIFYQKRISNFINQIQNDILNISLIILIIWSVSAITGSFLHYTTTLWYLMSIIGISCSNVFSNLNNDRKLKVNI